MFVYVYVYVGEFMCGVWVTADYFLTTASIFTMLAISVDRVWAVTWSINYSNNNTQRKTMIIIASVWLLDVVLIMPALIVDRVREHPRWTDPSFPAFRYDCIWDPAKNVVFVSSVMFFCYQVPLVLMIVCYLRVFYVMKRRARVTGRSVLDQSQLTASGAGPSASMSQAAANINALAEATVPGVVVAVANRDNSRRAFVTLTYIMASFIVFWGAFFVMFDIKAAYPEVVPDMTYTLLFWLPYFNSTLNPLLYGISNPAFRTAFRKLLKL